jgi:hypothetical protein
MCISILNIDMTRQELGEILNVEFVYFFICTVVDVSALYVQ